MEFQACKESELERADTPAMGQVTFVPRVQEAVRDSGGERVCALNAGVGDVGNG